MTITTTRRDAVRTRLHRLRAWWTATIGLLAIVALFVGIPLLNWWGTHKNARVLAAIDRDGGRPVFRLNDGRAFVVSAADAATAREFRTGDDVWVVWTKALWSRQGCWEISRTSGRQTDSASGVITYDDRPRVCAEPIRARRER